MHIATHVEHTLSARGHRPKLCGVVRYIFFTPMNILANQCVLSGSMLALDTICNFCFLKVAILSTFSLVLLPTA